MKLKELLGANEALQRVSQRQMPAKVAYNIARNLKKVSQELETFDATRLKLLEENWPLNSETGRYDVPPEDMSKWQEMYAELLDADVDWEPYTISMSQLERVELSPAEILALSWMVVD